MKTTIILLLILIVSMSNGQKFNLDFENQKPDGKLPADWFKWGNYELKSDSLSHGGKYAGKIISVDPGNSFGSIAYKIPARYVGSSIRLEGYMKIKNVKNGFAGLLLRIDGGGTSLAFDNMQNRNINGTKDWDKYTITLNYPEGAEAIYVAGLLTGKGEAWFDDFTVTIDDQDIQTLKEADLPTYKASLDKEFDTGSKVVIPKLNPEGIANLELLGRIWGFVKYYHPTVAKGNSNMDYELFRILPKYFAVKNKSARDQLLLQWIDGFGTPEKCNSCTPTSPDAFLKPDLSWITNGNMNSKLKEKLLFSYENRNSGKHFYIRKVPGVGNPEFTNENAYASMSYPDEGFRLLALFKYWNMINYFFPYKHLMDKDWNKTLQEYIPAMVEAKDELAYELTMVQLIGDVQDTHANLWGGGDKMNEWKGSYYPPVHVRFIENKLVVTDYYNPELKEKVGLEIGDVITQINGEEIASIIAKVSKYYPASNEPTRLRDISEDVLRANAEEIQISYTRNSTTYQTKLPLYERGKLNIYRWYKEDSEKCYKRLGDSIGYVTLKSIKAEDVSVIKKEFKNTKGIIIDIRNYPSTFVPFSLGSYFISSSTPFVKFTSGNIYNPGEFTFGSPIEIPKGEETYRGKLIVIVNELSQSQAEYTAMAFRAGDRTTIIGSTTAGADGNVSPILLPGGLRTMISGIGVYYPKGGETQRIGIVPDIEIKPTIEGVRKGKDELLEKAIELIKK